MTTTTSARTARPRRRIRAGAALLALAATVSLSGCRTPIGGNCEIWWAEPAIFNPGGALYTPSGSAITGLAMFIPLPVCGDQRNV